ncbi:MAG: protein translocase subunit SecF [Patescibacteria group bacterium]
MKPVYKLFFAVSMLLTIVALVATVVIWRKTHGEFLGIDFRGGSLLEVSFESGRPNEIIREKKIAEERRQEILKDLETQYGPVRQERFDDIGPTVGAQLKSKSIKAVVILLIVIVIYLAIVFRSMARVLSPWAMGIAAIAALLHDVIIPIGVFSILGAYYGVEISAVFVAAILTILGYSVSDTVVVFDRIRENVVRFGGKESFPELVHKSILQTLTRSINTSVTTLLALVAIFLFGGESVKYFALALIIGIVSGTYSSIFIASPIVVWWHGFRKKGI